VRYACIQEHREAFEVRLMCRLLRVTRSGFYAWVKRGLSRSAERDQRLRLEIRAAFKRSRGRYGSPRVLADLQSRGARTSRKRVARLMREDGLRAKKRRRFCITTDSSHSHPIAPNVLGRRFGVEATGGRDRVWVSDITYVPTREGWLYLAIVLDLGTRMVVGWSMSDTLESRLASDALEMALKRRRPATELMHHSDRGVQYASIDYRERLARRSIQVSMSRRANCWDNAVAESFFATLEVELLEGAEGWTKAEARSEIFEFIEIWYNRQRRHSSIGYLTPAEYDQQLAKRKAA
jgi:putative transposase